MAKVKHRLTTRKPWTYDTKVIDLLHESRKRIRDASIYTSKKYRSSFYS